MIAIVKVFLSKKIRDTIETHSSEDFLPKGEVPKEALPPAYGGTATPEKALQWLDERLAVRAENESSFSL